MLTDGIRQPDRSNPRGYFELEAVKQTRMAADWTQAAVGKAVKVIYRLLPDLPPAYHYRIIFMRRNLEEVVASQQAMLGRPPLAPAAARRLASIYERDLAEIDFFLKSRSEMQLLNVSHADTVCRPLAVAEQIAGFLHRPLDLPAMAAVVQPTLHRQRAVPAAAE